MGETYQNRHYMYECGLECFCSIYMGSDVVDRRVVGVCVCVVCNLFCTYMLGQ